MSQGRRLIGPLAVYDALCNGGLDQAACSLTSLDPPAAAIEI